MRLVCTLICCALLGAVGCSDDDPTAPPAIPEDDTFAIDLRVVGAAGDPVAGLRVSLSPEVPYVTYPVPGLLAKADLPGPLVYTLDIVDVAGSVVRQALPALAWDGRDDAGDPVHDGWYQYHAVGRDAETDEVVSDETAAVLLIAADPAWCAAGVTDADGRLTIADRTYVPGFWDLDPLVAVDEHGDPVAEITLTGETRVTLLADDGRWQWHVFEAEDGPQTVTVQWEPEP